MTGEAKSSDLPQPAITPDVVDRIASEIGLIVGHHIETMYPAAAKAVAWRSAKRSVQGVVRNAIASAGRAAENGTVQAWIENQRRNRRAGSADNLEGSGTALLRDVTDEGDARVDALARILFLAENRSRKDAWPWAAEFEDQADARILRERYAAMAEAAIRFLFEIPSAESSDQNAI